MEYTVTKMTVNQAILILENRIRCNKQEKEEAKQMAIKALKQEQKTGYCKDCKYFEYDSVAMVDEIPLIVAHEICSRWGDGCKTSENGYCFLFEPKEGSDTEWVN